MTRWRTIGLFLLVSVLFGTAFPAVKAGLAFVPPLLFAAARNYLAAVLLVGYVVTTQASWRPASRQDWAAVAAGGVFITGGSGLAFVGQQFISSGVAAIIFSLSPVVTALLVWVLLPVERLGPRGYLGVLLGFVGIGLVVRPDPGGLVAGETLGKSLLLAAVVLITLGVVLVRRSRSTLPISTLTAWSLVLGATIHLGAGLAIGESFAAVSPTPLAIGAVVYLGVFAGALGFVGHLTLLDRVGPLRANLVSYVTPVVALVTGWVLLGERVDPLAVVGFCVIAAGFFLIESTEVLAELARYRGAFR